MDKIAQAESIMVSALNRAGVTKDARLWLEHALDPFKDLPTPCRGFPDKNMNPSVVQVVKQSVNVASTSGTNTWYLSVYLDTLPTSVNVRQTGLMDPGLPTTYDNATQLATDYPLGGVVIRQANQVGGLYDFRGSTGNIPLATSYYNNGSTRIIGVAIEIRDVTPELNKQGAITTWRLPSNDGHLSIANIMSKGAVTPSVYVPTAYRQQELIKPPYTPSEAMLLPGTLQWEAREGAYIVAVLDDVVVPPTKRAASCPHIFENTLHGVPSMSAVTNNSITTWGMNQLHPDPHNWASCGALLTGLGQFSTFQINVNYIIERFVDSSAGDLATIATPSCPFDPMALELYTRIARTMPTGVPVRENGLGSLVMGIAKGLRSIVRPALKTANTIYTAFTEEEIKNAPKKKIVKQDTEKMEEAIAVKVAKKLEAKAEKPIVKKVEKLERRRERKIERRNDFDRYDDRKVQVGSNMAMQQYAPYRTNAWVNNQHPQYFPPNNYY